MRLPAPAAPYLPEHTMRISTPQQHQAQPGIAVLDVMICTYNPKAETLSRVMASLQAQALPAAQWTLTVIDNNSNNGFDLQAAVGWHPRGAVVVEPRQGLTFARIRAAQTGQAPLIVFVDDDNVLAPGYLQAVARRFEAAPRLAVVGGECVPEYGAVPPEWFSSDLAPLGSRSFGTEWQEASWQSMPRSYPAFAPIGAGMAIRREVLADWAACVATDARRANLGRKGNSLASGEDCDINLLALSRGWSVGYDPALSLTHLIAGDRVQPDYLKRLAYRSMRDWVAVLDLYGIRPWPPRRPQLAPLRKLRSWLQLRAWQSPAQKIRWHGTCGLIDGQARLSDRELAP